MNALLVIIALNLPPQAPRPPQAPAASTEVAQAKRCLCMYHGQKCTCEACKPGARCQCSAGSLFSCACDPKHPGFPRKARECKNPACVCGCHNGHACTCKPGKYMRPKKSQKKPVQLTAPVLRQRAAGGC